MKREQIIEQLEFQRELIKKEKKADYKFFEERMMNTSVHDRMKNGVTWFPIRIIKDFISTGERITLEISRTKNLDLRHSFQVGSVVGIFSESESKEKTLGGIISYLKENTMRIVLNSPELPDWITSDTIGINLLFDDGTYRDLDRALKAVINSKNDRLAELRGVFYGNSNARFTNQHIYDLPTLNEVQNEAFARIIHAEDVAFVHGPPGTGKTTTLTKCIKEVVRQEKQVLVCAPSNAAVDLLVEKLVNEDLNVLRIGHPARLTPEVVENSLDVRISKHADFSRLKDLRQQSEEYRKLAGKYKRNFEQNDRKQRELLYKEARQLKGASRDLENYITDNLVDQAQVVACTMTGSANSLINDRIFKTVFIDESSQALEAAAWIPITRGKRIIMSGDHFQLPPTIKSFEAAKEGLENTLFAKGIEAQPEAVVMLEKQYRMHPEIMGFSSARFYQNRLLADETILHRPSLFEESIMFVDTAGAGYDEKIKEETLSTYNEQEAEMTVQLLAQEVREDMSVGVIAPYKAQVELLTRLINESKELAPYRLQIDINSVDAFQGQERDIIFISLVRSNDRGEIGFLKEYRRLNVAMTRAKQRLVLIGDSATLGVDSFFGEMLDYVQQNGRYASVYEFQY